jgi:Na+-driven multidrug efflux pump
MSGAGLAATLSFTVSAIVLLPLFLKDTGFRYADLLINQNDWQLFKQALKRQSF